MAGRPREFDRDEALAKARDAFWTRGYEGTSMADLVLALGLASARIYAAFGSKEQLFRDAVGLYASGDGGFAARALAAEPTARQAIERMLRDAVKIYTRAGRPGGCMVVTAATNCAQENERLREWLADIRRAQTKTIVERLKRAVQDGELAPRTDARAWGDYFATLMHGLSVKARDGVSRARLEAAVNTAMRIFPASTTGAPSA